MYTLPAKEQDGIDGIVLFNVDDLLHGGTEKHHQKIADLRRRYKFGRTVIIMETGNVGTLVYYMMIS